MQQPWRVAAMALHYPMAMGQNKGHKVTKNMSKLGHSRECLIKTPSLYGTWSQEVVSFASYKQSALGLLKVSKDKQAKFIKKWMGTHIHAKRKQEELSNVLAAKMKAVAKDWAPCLLILCLIKPL